MVPRHCPNITTTSVGCTGSLRLTQSSPFPLQKLVQGCPHPSNKAQLWVPWDGKLNPGKEIICGHLNLLLLVLHLSSHSPSLLCIFAVPPITLPLPFGLDHMAFGQWNISEPTHLYLCFVLRRTSFWQLLSLHPWPEKKHTWGSITLAALCEAKSLHGQTSN